MNAPQWCTRLAVALVALAGVAQLVACSQTVVSVSGQLDRPSGLAYVARTSSTADCAPAAGQTTCAGQYRATLFIADSDAQGVRVVSLFRDYTLEVSASSGAVVRKTFNDAQRYALAPVAFFPLVIPAGGFPTELALSADGERLYVLAAATKTLHVLDVREPMGSTTESYRPISELSLDGIGTSTATPVALALLGSSETADYVAVAMDGGPTGSFLAGLTVSVGGAQATLAATSTAPIHGAPRALLVRGEVVVASSAAPAPCRATPAECASQPPSYALSLVRAERANGPLVLSDAQPFAPVELGGPASRLIDYGSQGFFAVRDDRSSLVFVQAMNDTYQRYPDFLPSPFTPEDERGSLEAIGRLDVRMSPVAASAWGWLPGGTIDPLVSNRAPYSMFRDPDGAPDVALLVHVDGRAAFVTGSPPELRLEDDSPVLSVYDESPPADAGQLQLGTANRGFCEAPPQVCGAALVAPACAADLVGTDADRLDPQVLRAAFQGNLVRSREGAVLARRGAAASAPALELRDPALASYSERQVRAGDQVRLQLALRAGCASADPPGASLDHTADPLVVWTTTVAALRERPGEAPVLVLGASAAAALAECPEGDVPAVTLRYEVYPADREMVVSRADGLGVARVFERVPTSTRAVTLGDVDEPTARHRAPLNLKLVSPSGFGCAEEVQPGAECATDEDCGGAGTCVAATASCYGRCAATCTRPSCAAPEAVRRCTGLRLGIGASLTATVDLNAGSGLSALPAPSHATFSPLRRSWFVSFPGAREVAELYSQPYDASAPANASPLDVRHVVR